MRCTIQASPSQTRLASQTRPTSKGDTAIQPFATARVNPVGKAMISAVRGAMSISFRIFRASMRSDTDRFESVRKREL